MEAKRLEEMDIAELRGWASVGHSGLCVHSFFAPARGQPCAGCMLRESQRALGMLLEVLDGGVEGPTHMHGLEIEDSQDAIGKARSIYLMVKDARGL